LQWRTTAFITLRGSDDFYRRTQPDGVAIFRHDRHGETTMSTAKFACRGSVATIPPHATGHARAKDGTLLRVDCERGIGWIARHYDLNLRVIQRVTGSDEEVHRAAARWAET
jgi:hypothetical protein